MFATTPEWATASRWAGLGVVLALHAAVIGALLQHQPARDALPSAAPIMVSTRLGPVVFLDPRTGAVLVRADRVTRTDGDAFLAWRRALHEGHVLGSIGRIVICAAGLLPALLVITGSIMWLRQRRGPQRAEHA